MNVCMCMFVCVLCVLVSVCVPLHRQIGFETTLYPDICGSTINKERNVMGGFVLRYGEMKLLGRLCLKGEGDLLKGPNMYTFDNMYF